MNNLTLRIISSFFLIFFFYSLLTKEILFSISIHFLISMALWEFLRLSNFQIINKNLFQSSDFFLTRQRIDSFDYLLIIFINILCFFLIKKLFILFIFFTLLLLFFLFFQKVDFKKIIGTSYISSSVFFLILLNYDKNYEKYILVIIFYTIVTDISSYFVGKLIGGPRLAPRISPGKTISGSFGGLIIPTLLSYFIFSKYENSFFLICFTSIVFSLIVQSGDLIESYFKRNCFVKESSNLIPGHGGVLDRFDGFLLLIFFVYILKFFNFNFFFIM